ATCLSHNRIGNGVGADARRRSTPPGRHFAKRPRGSGRNRLHLVAGYELQRARWKLAALAMVLARSRLRERALLLELEDQLAREAFALGRLGDDAGVIPARHLEAG